MPKQVEIDGVEVELDDDIDPEDLDKGAESRGEDEVDLDKLAEEAEAIEDGEDEYV